MALLLAALRFGSDRDGPGGLSVVILMFGDGSHDNAIDEPTVPNRNAHSIIRSGWSAGDAPSG